MVDTNVVVSAALRDREPEAVILHIVATSGVEWLATPWILEEYRAVLRRPKFGLEATQLAEWDRLLAAAVLVVEPGPKPPWAGDPGDVELVACALATSADYLITGDRGLLGAGRLGTTLVVTVSQFKRSVCDRAG
ncbi:MAG: putative toxin-antitoxin system toxin component, PIN family [Phycisphaerales bacterium]